MRTNYKRIKNIINKNFSVEVIDSPAKGIVLVDPDSDRRVRVILVDYNYHTTSSEVGIHCRLMDKSELEGQLIDAIETAFKDMFPCIYLHQTPKPSEERRLSRIKTVRSWLEKPRVELQCSLNKVFDLDSTLESMSEPQLDLLLAFISGIFQSAHGDSRDKWCPRYHNLRKALIDRGVSAMETHNIADARAVSNE